MTSLLIFVSVSCAAWAVLNLVDRLRPGPARRARRASTSSVHPGGPMTHNRPRTMRQDPRTLQIREIPVPDDLRL